MSDLFYIIYSASPHSAGSIYRTQRLRRRNRRQELADAYHELIGREEANSLDGVCAEVLVSLLRLGLLAEMATKQHSQRLNSTSVPHWLIRPISPSRDLRRKGGDKLCVSTVYSSWWLSSLCYSGTWQTCPHAHGSPIELPGSSKLAVATCTLTRVIIKSKQSSHAGGGAGGATFQILEFTVENSIFGKRRTEVHLTYWKGRVIKSPLPLGSLLYSPSAQSWDLLFHLHYKSRAGKGRHTS